MAFSYLDETSVFKLFKESKAYMQPFFDPLAEYERIARNRPHPGIDPSYPKVTDGTTSSIIEKTPRRILQQIPTGTAYSSNDQDWVTPFAGYILREKIIPNANTIQPFLQKAQSVSGKSLTYGGQPSYTFVKPLGEDITADFTPPYIKDVFLQPGKLSHRDCNYIFMRSWYQKTDIDAMIAKSSQLQDEEIDDGWIIENLKAVRNSLTKKDDQAVTPSEKDKNARQSGVEIIHGFQKGVKASFYSFHVSTGLILRKRTNPDPRGHMPVQYDYSGIDMSNPIGRGWVEQVGSMQNLMDAEVQMYQYNRALMLNPPTTMRGNWNKDQAKLAPNILVDLGSDPNASWEALSLDSTAISQFSNNYSLMQSQIYQQLSAPNANIPATAGNTQFSKTDTGVKQQQANLSVDDTYVRNLTEAWLEEVFETMLNLYFAEKHGIEVVQLDEETANEIKDIDESLVNDKNQIRVDWDKEAQHLIFKIDAGSSEVEDDQYQVEQLKETINEMNAAPNLQSDFNSQGKQLNTAQMWSDLIEKSGIKNVDKIITDLPKNPDGSPQLPPPQPNTEAIKANYTDLDPQAKAAYLQALNIPADPNQIAQYEQQKAAEEAPQATASIEDHPLIKLMSSLQIKFTDLPEDAKHELLAQVGLPSQMNSPVHNDQAIKAITASHQIMSGQAQEANQQAQMEQQQAQNDAQNQLAANDQQMQQQQTASNNQDDQHMQQLLAMGLDQKQAQQALALIDAGYPPEDALNMIEKQTEKANG